MDSPLILPGDPLFDITLATPPPNWRQVAEASNGSYVFLGDENGMLRAASGHECREYLLGGEYDERIGENWESDDIDLEGVEEIYIDF